ncbi:MAG TPA: hypothetical protein VJ001_12570 [Rhodocyclaceae bacterium]|nr:hypothetical protein [Rhodocyclaceae bacterium]
MTHLARLETYTVDDYRHWEGDWESMRGSPVAMTPAPEVGV